MGNTTMILLELPNNYIETPFFQIVGVGILEA